MQTIINLVEKQLNQYRPQQINATLELLEAGNTVPFIARYRKEKTDSLDEVQIREIQETYQYLTNLEKRKSDILKRIEELDQLTPKLKQQILEATQLQALEDLYLPYKQKKRTKATIAKEAGLQPLADSLLAGEVQTQSELDEIATALIKPDTDFNSLESIYAGAHEILAEQVGEIASLRDWIRRFTWQNGQLQSELKKNAVDEKAVYQTYYEFNQALTKIQPYQYLAINRAESEKILKVALIVNEAPILKKMQVVFAPKIKPLTANYLTTAIEDSYKRFIAPAIERELRKQLKDTADQQAINVFGDNLSHLLLQAPLKGKVVLGFDPAYRTGCKLAVVDENGKFLEKLVIYPHKPASQTKREHAKGQFQQLLKKYHVQMVAIGNGTASRESEEFVAEALQEMTDTIYYVIVNEAGASVYSASDTARAEFPELQVEERSAISIARRLQDPLAELIKIDPKSVGVGQYQHDVSQKSLSEKLDQVIEDVVNHVGVNLNTASPQLLQHISGLNTTIAQNIVNYRNENGAFTNRTQLKKVPRLGPKAYEQAVGFLRIINGKNPLDNTDIHPESYATAKAILVKLNLDLTAIGTSAIENTTVKINLKAFSEQLQISEITLQDILTSLKKPGRDLRDNMPAPLLRQDVLKLEDLKPGMQMQGTVRNVIDFGAFVDIGVKQDGLVHLSQLADHFVKNPSDEVAVGDIVKVWVLSVDQERHRIQLTMVAPKDNEND